MKHALKYFSSRNVPSLRPNGVCFLTQSGKNIVLLKSKMNTMKNVVLSFTLHCCLGKIMKEWLRSLLSSYSSVFHQDSHEILEIS